MLRILFLILLSAVPQAHSMFLWSYDDATLGSSCCLHYADQDICNPGIACSGNVMSDLRGLDLYLDRLIGLDKIDASPVFKVIKSTKSLIESLLKGNVQLNYIVNYKKQVSFLHTLLEAKSDKSVKSATPPSVPAAKTADQDYLLKFLMKLGVAWAVR